MRVDIPGAATELAGVDLQLRVGNRDAEPIVYLFPMLDGSEVGIVDVWLIHGWSSRRIRRHDFESGSHVLERWAALESTVSGVECGSAACDPTASGVVNLDGQKER